MLETRATRPHRNHPNPILTPPAYAGYATQVQSIADSEASSRDQRGQRVAGPPGLSPPGLPPGLRDQFADTRERIPVHMGKAPSYQTISNNRATTLFLEEDPRAMRGATPGTTRSTHEHTNATDAPTPACASGDPAATDSIVPTPSPGSTPATFDAAWMQTAAEGRALIRLSDRENQIEFTEEEVRVSVSAALTALARGWNGDIIVTAFGRTGPWQIALDSTDADLLEEAECVFLTQVDRERDLEHEFIVTRLNPDGSIRRVHDESAPLGAASLQERAERIRRNEARAAEKKRREFRCFIDGPAAVAMFNIDNRKAFFQAATDRLRYQINASLGKPAIERMDMVLRKTKEGGDLNGALVYVTLQRDLDRTAKEWLAASDWSSNKYLQMGYRVPPAKVRLPKEITEAMGVKPCCFLPRCRGAARCTAMEDAYRASGLTFPSGFTAHGPSNPLQPTHEMIRNERKRQQELASIENAKRRGSTLDRLSKKRCHLFHMGQCHRKVCARKHGSVRRAAQIMCFSKTQAGIDQGFVCIHGDDCIFKGLDMNYVSFELPDTDDEGESGAASSSTNG